MDSVTVEDWGEKVFAEGVGVKWKKWAMASAKNGLCTNPLPVKHAIRVQL